MEETTVRYNPKEVSSGEVKQVDIKPIGNITQTDNRPTIIPNDVIDFSVLECASINFLSGCDTNIEYYNNNQKWCYNKYKNTNKFSDYPIFRDLLLDNQYTSKPARDSRYATQGVCQIGNTTFITSYDTGYSSRYLPFATSDEGKSVLDIIDTSGREKRLKFDNEAHVGGVSYNPYYQKMFVSGPDGTVNIYDLNDIANAEDGSTLNNYKQIKVAHQASYLTVHDNDLIVGEFTEKGPGRITIYKITENGSNLSYARQIEVPYPKAQGMCVLEKNGEKYYVFSCSYGRKNDSKLIVSKQVGDTFQTVSEVKLPCMSEQVSVDSNGNLMVIFESDCNKYGYQAYGSTTLIGNVIHLNADKLISPTVNV